MWSSFESERIVKSRHKRNSLRARENELCAVCVSVCMSVSVFYFAVQKIWVPHCDSSAGSDTRHGLALGSSLCAQPSRQVLRPAANSHG